MPDPGFANCSHCWPQSRAGASTHEQFNTPTQSDYSVEFHPCGEMYGYMGHMQTLDPGFANRIGPLDSSCTTCTPQPGVNVTARETPRLDIMLTPGEVIGTTGGVTHVTGIGFGLQDGRIQPLQLHARV